MITKENFVKVLEYLGFEKHANVYSKHYGSTENDSNSFELKTNIGTGEFLYPEGVKADRETTKDAHQAESYVVFACIAQLFALGYKPNHIKLEGKNYSGTDKGYTDILINDNDDDEYLIIECKTEDLENEKEDEFRKHWRKTLHNGDQLFRYFNTYRKAKYLCLFSCDWTNNKLENTYHVISLNDNKEYLKTNKKLRGYDDVRAELGGYDEYFEVWKNTYKQDYATRGIFEEGLEPFKIGVKKYSIDDLVEIDQNSMQKKYNRFAEILRQHNVSSKENAFDKLVNLFLSKIVDETENKQELKCLWKGTATDNFFDLQDRLQDLYRKGMYDFFGDTVTYVANQQIEDAFKFLNEHASFAKDKIKDLLFDLKYFNNNPFAFLDVHNEDLFYKNAVILIEVVKMLQDIKLKTETQNQFLGDLFEGFLDQGIKQSEGQFFTPLPIVRFLISSLPLQQIIQKTAPDVIDYACGAGHFLTEFASQIKPIIKEQHKAEIDKYKDGEQRKKHIADLMKKYNQHIVGIEKEYRLSKVSQVSAFMYGQDGVNIIYADALSHIEKIKNNSFDVLVANPPYSVKGFLETLTEDEKNDFELINEVSDLSKNNAIETFFIERAKQLLRTDGIAAIILPVTVLEKIGIYTKCREIILKHFDIVAIFKSGSGTFGKTGTATSTLFLRRRACNKDGDTDIVKHFTHRVETWFAGCFDNDTYYDDYPMFENYCSHIGVDISDYKTLFSKSVIIDSSVEDNDESYLSMAAEPIVGYGVKRYWRDALSGYEMFSSYISKFEDDKKARDLKEKIKNAKNKTLRGKYTQDVKDKELADLNNRLESYVLDSIIAIEKEKLLYFMLAESNRQKIVFVRTPNILKPNDTKGQKEFLGYTWSYSKGKEGIKYLNVVTKKATDGEEIDDTIQQLKGIDGVQTPLFNPQDLYDAKKINTLIRRNYTEEISVIPESLKDYVSLFKLTDMLDFSRTEFNKEIKLTADKKVEIMSKYPLVNLGEYANMKGGDTFKVIYQGNHNTSDIPFFKVGDMNTIGNEISMTISNNYVDEDTLKNKLKATIFPESTIVFPKVGMAIHTNKKRLLGRNAAVDNNTMALWPKNEEILSYRYLYNYFLSEVDLSSVASDSNPPSISASNLSILKIPLPPINIQHQIVSECEKVDEEYNKSRISLERCNKKILGLYQLFEDNREIDYIELQKILVKINGNKTKIAENQITQYGKYPVVTQESNRLIAGYTNEEKVIDDLPIIVFGDHTCSLKYVDFPFVRGADGTQLLKVNTEIIIPKFLYGYLLTIQIENAGNYGRHYKYLKRVKVPVPSKIDQQRIVSEIESYEAEIAKAKAVMAGCAERKKQILEKWLR